MIKLKKSYHSEIHNAMNHLQNTTPCFKQPYPFILATSWKSFFIFSALVLWLTDCPEWIVYLSCSF